MSRICKNDNRKKPLSCSTVGCRRTLGSVMHVGMPAMLSLVRLCLVTSKKRRNRHKLCRWPMTVLLLVRDVVFAMSKDSANKLTNNVVNSMLENKPIYERRIRELKSELVNILITLNPPSMESRS